MSLRVRRSSQFKTVITIKHNGSVTGALHRNQEEEVVLTERQLPLGLSEEETVATILKLIKRLDCAVLINAVLDGRPLRQIAKTEFKRLIRHIQWQSAQIELSADKGYLQSLVSDVRLPFQEIELELKAGPMEDLLRCGSWLTEQYDLTPQPTSKLQQALSLESKQVNS